MGPLGVVTNQRSSLDMGLGVERLRSRRLMATSGENDRPELPDSAQDLPRSPTDRSCPPLQTTGSRDLHSLWSIDPRRGWSEGAEEAVPEMATVASPSSSSPHPANKEYTHPCGSHCQGASWFRVRRVRRPVCNDTAASARGSRPRGRSG